MELDEFTKMYELEDSHWWFLGKRRIAERIITNFVPLSPDSYILDVGCGTGGMMSVLNRHGRPFGLDINRAGLQFASRRGFDQLAQGSALTLPFADGRFDLVTGFDVLYHEEVEDDLVALREFFRVCRPGGSLLLTDSALGILRSQHDKAYHATRRYSAGELREKVTDAGFKVLKVTYANTMLFPIVLAVRLWKRYVPSGSAPQSDLWAVTPLLNRLLFRVYSLEASLLPLLNLPVGSSVVCVARKERVGGARGG